MCAGTGVVVRKDSDDRGFGDSAARNTLRQGRAEAVAQASGELRGDEAVETAAGVGCTGVADFDQCGGDLCGDVG